MSPQLAVEAFRLDRRRQSGHAAVPDLDDDPRGVCLPGHIHRDETILETSRHNRPLRYLAERSTTAQLRCGREQFSLPEEHPVFLMHGLAANVVFKGYEF